MFSSSIDVSTVGILPKAVFTGKIVVVDRVAQVEEAVRHLLQYNLLGFDTETRPSFSKGQRYKMSLLQLSSEECAYLFRLNQIGLPKPLIDLLENEHVLKIGAAIRDDIRGLQGIRGFHPSGFVDLQILARSHGILEISVRKMAAIVLQLRVSKVQQLSNWDSPKLTPAQESYAATDAWICREIYKQMQISKPEICNDLVR